MRIVDMQVTPIAISDPPLRNAAGLHAPYALRTIVELRTDDGISGLGETHGGSAFADALLAARDHVVGRDPFALTPLRLALEGAGQAPTANRPAGQTNAGAARVFSPIEVACLDIIGKAVGRPVVDLLGGKVRERVPFSAYLFFKHAGAGGALGFERDPAATGWAATRQAEALDVAGIVEQAEVMCATYGFESIKLKAGTLPPEVEVAAIMALRERFGPATPLRIDPNGVWSVPTAIAWGERLAGVLEYYEDPVLGQAAMAEVAKAVSMPLATNMCTTSFAHLPGSVRLGSEQIILMDHHIWGGLRASMELARICDTFGRGMSMHSNSHLGISLAAMTHLAAAVPNLTYACDTHYPWQTDEVLVGGTRRIEGGAIEVSGEPGLGIELDRAALAELHQRYLTCGLTRRDDELEMQKVEPGWTFAGNRW